MAWKFYPHNQYSNEQLPVEDIPLLSDFLDGLFAYLESRGAKLTDSLIDYPPIDVTLKGYGLSFEPPSQRSPEPYISVRLLNGGILGKLEQQ